MAIVLHDGSLQTALSIIERVLADPDPYNPEFEDVELGDWASIRIEIEDPEVQSSITPPFMEAFLELQKQVYQLGALIETGVANTQYLTEADILRLQITVQVSGGSSNYLADLHQTIGGLLKKMIGKMTGKQATVVILGVAILIAGQYAFSAWLEQRRTVKIEELKTQEHLAALRHLSFANEEQSKTILQIIEVVKGQGEIGKRAVEAVIATNEALLKAASKTREVVINENHLTRIEAELLRASPKKKLDIAYVRQPVRVVSINTSDPKDLQLVLLDPQSGEEHRVKFPDTLFASSDRRKIFLALERREPIWVELAIKSVEGEIRSVQLLRCIDPPTEAMISEEP